MKTINLLTILFLCLLCSCNSGNKPNVSKVSFGIYETVKAKDLPVSFMETLKTTSIQFEKNTQTSIIGYIEKGDTLIFQADFSKENFRIVKSFFPVEKDGKYFVLAAVKCRPLIDNSDVNNTEYKGKIVEIHFNLKGAKKWSELTKNNIGKMVAFTIDNQIYTMPVINGEIKTGEALINELKDEMVAKNLSESLNSSIMN